jgi:hypothetical protein
MKVGWLKCCTDRTAVGRVNPRGRQPLFGLPRPRAVYSEGQTLNLFAVAPPPHGGNSSSSLSAVVK